jgi:hypothetical protein
MKPKSADLVTVFRSMGGQEKKHQFSLFFNLQIDQNINFAKLPSVKWLFFACFKL